MKPTLKRKWIKALRSGKYKQGRAALKSGNTFCCIGVLADIQKCEWRNSEPFIKGRSVGLYQNNADGFVDYEGVEYLRPSFAGMTVKTQERLGGLNDEGRSFKEIAEAIEKTIR